MKEQLLFSLTTILSLNCYSQISFEKGYYINNSGLKTDCLVRNMDWKNNPTEFEYTLSEDDKPKKATIKSVKEFGIDNISKYIREIVNIDRSGESINNLSRDKNPILNKEELFLKVLVEGKSNLYEYVDGNLRRYFYTKENADIEQLIFKSYRTEEGNIGRNNKFREQLWVDLKYPDFKISKIESVDYNKRDLVRFFTEYSEYHNKEVINFIPKQDLLNLTIRPRLNSSSLTIQHTAIYRYTDFGNKTGFGFGLEAEVILPFNKNKWAIAIEPTYQNFRSEKITNTNNVSGGKLMAIVDYHSVEFPVSVRHYFFLNDNSKIFINASFIFDLSSKSLIELKRADNSGLDSLKIGAGNNLALGAGYKLNDKYSIEIRYQTSREVLDNHRAWNSDYRTFSLIFGYSLF